MPHPQNQNSNNEPFDWAYIYYVGRNVVGLSEDEFWESSVEKINELCEVHGALNDEDLAEKRRRKINNESADNVGDVFIDNVSFL